jgi:toxin CcdB
MAQFDVHRLANSPDLVLDCQSDLLDHMDSRFVVPLLARAIAPPRGRRLNPEFDVGGEYYVMATQGAATVTRRDLGPVVASLAEHSFEITGAIDVLIGGV